MRFYQTKLLYKRSFAPFFCTQFLGAFNDNFFKTAVLTALTFDTVSWTSININLLNNLIAGIFILPFFLFSASAGQIADKFEKSQLIRIIKVAEVIIICIASIGWYTHNIIILMLAIMAMGIQSAAFGPIKYSYLPQHFDSEELLMGNGIIQMGTFAGILIGQILGAIIVFIKIWEIEIITIFLIFISILGLIFSKFIPISKPNCPSLRINPNPLSEIIHNLKYVYKNKKIFIAMLANSWFWFFGAIYLTQFPAFTKKILNGEPEIFSVLLSSFSLGIGVGAVLCQKISTVKTQNGLIFLGSLGLTIFGIDLFFASSYDFYSEKNNISMFLNPWGLRIAIDCILLGISAGLYIVPLIFLIQTQSDSEYLSRIIGGMNILNSFFMVLAAIVAIIILKFGFFIHQIFLFTSILNFVLLLILSVISRDYPKAFINWFRYHFFMNK